MNPFIYPKLRHSRVLNPPNYASYGRYKPFLREEFERKCVYCRMPDTMRGEQGYGADHYRPKKLFPELAATYANLFYCCNPCNSRKGGYWPDGDQASARFIPNPCDHEMFAHLRFQRASVEAKTTSGEFTLELLDLNDPESLNYRKFVLETIAIYEKKRNELQVFATQIRSKRDAGEILLSDADHALAKIELDLEKTSMNLLRLSGGK